METINDFCKQHGLSEEEFFGKKILVKPYLEGPNFDGPTSIPDGFNPSVVGDLYLNNLKSIPKGFNPTVMGRLLLNGIKSIPKGFSPTVRKHLYLSRLKSIPKWFNPPVGGDLYLNRLKYIPKGFRITVGGNLYLMSLTSVPEGFSPIVGGNLYLNNLKSIPEDFSPTVGGNVYINSQIITKKIDLPKGHVFSWQGYILCDGIFSAVVSKKKNVYKIREIGYPYDSYLIVDGEFAAHGRTLKEAKNDLIFKINRGKFKEADTLDEAIASEVTFKPEKTITPDTYITIDLYRAITGACEYGIKYWMDFNGIQSNEMKASELLPLLEKTDAYGLEEFKKHIRP